MPVPAATRSARATERRRRRTRSRRLLSTILAGLLPATILVAGAGPAAADLGDPGSVTLDKSVNGVPAVTLEPGEGFLYRFDVGCDDNACIDVELTDELPAALAGFAIVGLTVSVSQGVAEPTARLDGCAVGGTVTVGCTLRTTFNQQLGVLGGEPRYGIADGETASVTLRLAVPAGLSPEWAWNGEEIVNTATATAVNDATPATDQATVTVNVDYEVGVDVTKQWASAGEQYAPGAQTSFTVGIRNTSNAQAARLVLQDPAAADEGAASLAPSNPFRSVDLVGLCEAPALPAGADQVQVDAYVPTGPGGTWTWVTGTASAAPALPTGVSAADVGGLRLTYTSTAGATIAPQGAGATQCVTVAQRASDRVSGDDLVHGVTVSNTASGTVEVPDQDPVTEQATDVLPIEGLDVVVGAGKRIPNGQVPASDRFAVEISANNDSNGPLQALTLAEPGTGGEFLSEDLRFAGLTQGDWPAGATSAEIVWHFSDAADQTVSFDADDLPPATPSVTGATYITGFTTTWSGRIAPGAAAGWHFDVQTAEDTVPQGVASLTFTNTVRATGTNPAGTDIDDASAPVEVFYPTLGVELDKQLRPTLVTPGGTAVATLAATTAADSSAVRPTTIVLEDVWDGTPATFWDAFRARGIVLTDVPEGATMTVEYATGAPPALTWAVLDTVDHAAAPYTVDDLGDVLPGGVVADDLVGLRFTFTNTVDGFAQGTVVRANVVAEAAAALRSDPATPTATAGGPVVEYENLATTTVTGRAGAVTLDPAHDQDDDAVGVIAYPGGRTGTVHSDKRWVDEQWDDDLTTIAAQSGSLARTALGWGVTVPGYDAVTITDAVPGQEASPAGTAYQAFDLRSIRAVSYATDPLLRWDTVSVVELYLPGTGWVEVAPNDGATGPTRWMSTTGFKGYTLTDDQSAAATGVRLTVVPNDAARAAESFDPTRPAPGTGVAWGAAPRQLGLVWQLRNRMRDEGGATPAWVTEDATLNAGIGVVRNTSRVAAASGADAVVRDASDDIALVDLPPNVVGSKTATLVGAPGGTTVVAPYPGEVDPAAYPQVDFTLRVRNTSSARASYLQVVEPGCATGSDCVTADWSLGDVFDDRAYDASANPFERFTLTDVSVTVPTGMPVDQAASRAVLWHRADDGTLSVTEHALAQLAGLDATALADVVGLAVAYQSTAPEVTGGLLPAGTDVVLTLRTQLRATMRSDAAVPVTGGASGVTVRNLVAGQSFDPVLYPDARPNGSYPAQVLLTDATLDVTAGKSFSRDSIDEPAADTPLQVTLSATDGTATLAPQQVTIADDAPGFWDAFALVGLGAVQRPAGAALARVDVLLDGSTAWLEGSPVAAPAAPALPATVTDPTRVTGVRFVFSNADGSPFSRTVRSADWSASAVLDIRLRDGVTFPGEVSDTVGVESSHEGRPSAVASATDVVTLSLGTPVISVQKESPVGYAHLVAPGEALPWTLSFTNVGTSYLGIRQLVDDLGEHVRFAGEQPTYTSVGLLPTEGVTISQPEGGESLVFDFPPGSRMAPGDTFTVTVDLILLPGLLTGQTAINEFWVDVDRTLAAGDCVNTSGNGRGVLPGLVGTDRCGTSNFVGPVPGPLLFAEKEVRADVDGDRDAGAVNVTNPDLPCAPQPGGWYRTVCTPYTVVGGVDAWRIGASNTGTDPYRDLTFVDVLPASGDVLLAQGLPRGSGFRPTLSGERGITPDVYPAGLWDTATYEAQVTTTPAACVGATGTAWNADPTCAAAAWTPWDSYTGDWADVTAIRVVVDFADSRPLQPGELVSFVYHTVNTPATDAVPDSGALAPALWPDGSPFAWNQVGTFATMTSGEVKQRAPARTGVQLAVGALEVRKAVTGEAIATAPGEVVVDVSCTVAGAAVDLGEHAALVVPTGGSARIDGIPLGARCDIEEHGTLGAFGEAARIPAGAQRVEIETATPAGESVPATQVVTVTNRYDPAPPVVVTDPDGPTPTPTPTVADPGGPTPPPAEPQGGPASLPRTGANGPALAGALVLALALVASGAFLVVMRRRRC